MDRIRHAGRSPSVSTPETSDDAQTGFQSMAATSGRSRAVRGSQASAHAALPPSLRRIVNEFDTPATPLAKTGPSLKTRAFEAGRLAVRSTVSGKAAAIHHARETLTLARAAGNVGIEAWANGYLAELLTGPEATHHGQESVRLAGLIQKPAFTSWAHCNLSLSLPKPEAIRQAGIALQLATQSGDRRREASALMRQSQLTSRPAALMAGMTALQIGLDLNDKALQAAAHANLTDLTEGADRIYHAQQSLDLYGNTITPELRASLLGTIAGQVGADRPAKRRKQSAIG